MDYIEIGLPIFILTLAFFYKLSVDRAVNVPNLVQSICELPVDIIFLSISFMAAYTISEPKGLVKGLGFCLIFVLLAFIIVILWRKSLKLFENRSKWWILLLCLNLMLSILPLICSVNVLLDTRDSVKIEKVEPQIDQNGD